MIKARVSTQLCFTLFFFLPSFIRLYLQLARLYKINRNKRRSDGANGNQIQISRWSIACSRSFSFFFYSSFILFFCVVLFLSARMLEILKCLLNARARATGQPFGIVQKSARVFVFFLYIFFKQQKQKQSHHHHHHRVPSKN